MKKSFLLIFCVVAVFVSCNETKTSSKTENVHLISVEEMEELIKLENTQLIDIRTEQEFTAGHIEGAQNLVYDENFLENIQKLDKSQPVAVYCHSGGRSEKCVELLIEAGFKKIYDLEGGITEWVYEERDTIQ